MQNEKPMRYVTLYKCSGFVLWCPWLGLGAAGEFHQYIFNSILIMLFKKNWNRKFPSGVFKFKYLWLSQCESSYLHAFWGHLGGGTVPVWSLSCSAPLTPCLLEWQHQMMPKPCSISQTCACKRALCTRLTWTLFGLSEPINRETILTQRRWRWLLSTPVGRHSMSRFISSWSL